MFVKRTCDPHVKNFVSVVFASHSRKLQFVFVFVFFHFSRHSLFFFKYYSLFLLHETTKTWSIINNLHLMRLTFCVSSFWSFAGRAKSTDDEGIYGNVRLIVWWGDKNTTKRRLAGLTRNFDSWAGIRYWPYSVSVVVATCQILWKHDGYSPGIRIYRRPSVTVYDWQMVIP